MKRSILVAALTAFLLSLSTAQSANAQIFQFQSCQTIQRPRLFPRLFGFWAYPNYPQTTARGCVGGSCSTASPTCSGGSCNVDPVGRDEYVPTDEGNVPVEEYKKTTVAATVRWLAVVNATRARYGRRALRGDATLDAGAAQATRHCASVGYLDHIAGNEILAYNSSGIEVAIRSWLESPAHRAYLLSSSFSTAGISVVRDKYGRVWCAMRFR